MGITQRGCSRRRHPIDLSRAIVTYFPPTGSYPVTLFPGGNRWSGVSYPSLTSLIQRSDVKPGSSCVGTSESPLCDSEKIARCDSTDWEGWGSRRGLFQPAISVRCLRSGCPSCWFFGTAICDRSSGIFVRVPQAEHRNSATAMLCAHALIGFG